MCINDCQMCLLMQFIDNARAKDLISVKTQILANVDFHSEYKNLLTLVVLDLTFNKFCP